MKKYLILLILFCFLFPLAVQAEEAAKPEKIQIETKDGVVLYGLYQKASPQRGAVILLPMLSKTKLSWSKLQRPLAERGFSSLALDLRGHGESISKNGREIYWRTFSNKDFSKMTLDVEAAYDFMKKKEHVSPDKIYILGASIGANLALLFASGEEKLGGILLLSPGLDYRGIETEGPAKIYGKRPIFYAASRGDASSFEAMHYLSRFTPSRTLLDLEGEAHGTDLLESDDYLVERIINWLEVEAGGEPVKTDKAA